MIKKIIYKICIFLIIVFYFNFAEAAEEIYYPHPIIFVHGLNSDPSTWLTARTELWKYFYNSADNECKYPAISYPYLGVLNYKDQNKGDIRTIALGALRNEIDNAIRELPASQKKVIIVAHSMGGLVTRALLGLLSEYRNYVDRVIFIGTPHSGSPYASAVWLLNKIRNEIIYPALADYSGFYSINAGSHFRFSDASSFLSATGLPSQSYDDLSSKLQKEGRLFDTALSFSDEQGLTESIALEQLRLNQDVSFQKTIESSIGGKKIDINLYGRIFGNDTFLGQANYLAQPNNFKVIRGQDPYSVRIFIEMIKNSQLNSLFMGIPNLLTLGIDNFSYPTDLSITDAINTGDGIVPQASQEGIGAADYTISAFHTDTPNAYPAILQSLDDKPLIERIEVVPGDPYYDLSPTFNYVKVKVKDYLLADIEITEMKVNGQSIDLTSFLDPSTNAYKPYYRHKKDFLRGRTDTQAPIYSWSSKDQIYSYLTLEPGEFWVKVNYSSIHSVFVKIKNVAGENASSEVAYPVIVKKEEILEPNKYGIYFQSWNNNFLITPPFPGWERLDCASRVVNTNSDYTTYSKDFSSRFRYLDSYPDFLFTAQMTIHTLSSIDGEIQPMTLIFKRCNFGKDFIKYFLDIDIVPDLSQYRVNGQPLNILSGRLDEYPTCYVTLTDYPTDSDLDLQITIPTYEVTIEDGTKTAKAFESTRVDVLRGDLNSNRAYLSAIGE